jgi:hypothetical protein
MPRGQITSFTGQANMNLVQLHFLQRFVLNALEMFTPICASTQTRPFGLISFILSLARSCSQMTGDNGLIHVSIDSLK